MTLPSPTSAPKPLIDRASVALGTVFSLFTFAALVLAVVPLSGVNSTFALVSAVITGPLGYLLLRRRESDRLSVIAREQGDPIAAYEKVSQLFGLKGFLRTTNITGMPFATIAMTIAFCTLAFLSHIVNAVAGANGASAEVIPKEFPQAVLELAKLTLGAFIGSFVTKRQAVDV